MMQKYAHLAPQHLCSAVAALDVALGFDPAKAGRISPLTVTESRLRIGVAVPQLAGGGGLTMRISIISGCGRLLVATGLVLALSTDARPGEDEKTSASALEAAKQLNLAINLAKADETPTTLEAALLSVFTQAADVCSFPTKAKKQVAERILIPGEVRNALGSDLDLLVRRIPGENVVSLLHQIRAAGGNPVPVQGSGTYRSLDVFRLTDPNKNQLSYAVDCSGYLTLALSAGLSFGGNELKSSANVSAKGSHAFLVAQATLFSPVAIALTDGVLPAALSNNERLDILWALETQYKDEADTFALESPRYVNVVWTATHASSALQGAAEGSASGGLHFVFASASANSTAGIAYQRKIRFDSFDTFPLFFSAPDLAVRSTLGAVRARLAGLFRQTSSISTDEVNGAYQLKMDFPQDVCDSTLTWKVSDRTISSPKYSDGSCVFTVSGLTAEQMTVIKNDGQLTLDAGKAGKESLAVVVRIAGR